MKKISEKLKETRQEKIKIKGLSDFQKQIDDCVKEQKEIENIMVALNLLKASTYCLDIEKEQDEIKISLDKST